MESARFDDLVRSLSPGFSRRGVLAALVNGLLAILPLALGDEEAAGRRKKRRRRKEKRKNTVVSCVPNCERKICGDDGCGGSCGSCVPDFTCQAGVCVCLTNVFCGGTCVDLLTNPNHCGVCSNSCEDAGANTACRNGNCCDPDGFQCFCTPAGSACNAETCCQNGGSGACLATGVCP